MGNKLTEPVRLFWLDAVKALAIFLMILTHVGEVFFSYAWEDKAFCPQAGAWQIFESWTTILAPALFMFSMGVTFNYSHRFDPVSWMVRGLKLILTWFLLKAAYCLVAIRHLCAEDLTTGEYLVRTVFYSDILCFAGLFLVFVGLLRKLRVPKTAIGLVALGMFIAGQFVAVNPPGVFLQAITGLFVATPVTAFPLFHWILHPILGFAWGMLLVGAKNRDRFFTLSLCAAVPVLLGVVGWYLSVLSRTGRLPTMDLVESAYVVNPGVLVASFAVFVFVCSVFHFVLKGIGDTVVGRACTFVASRLTVIYCVQWVVIPCIDIFLPMWPSGTVFPPVVIVGCALAVYVFCILVSEPARRLKDRILK